jgi:hypothetical protein
MRVRFHVSGWAAKRRIFAWAHRRSLAYLSAAWSEELARRQARIVGPHLRVARLARTRSKPSKGDPASMTCGRLSTVSNSTRGSCQTHDGQLRWVGGRHAVVPMRFHAPDGTWEQDPE